MVDRDSFEELAEPAFWTSLCPQLSLTDLPFHGDFAAALFDRSQVERERDLQLLEGHLRLPSVVDAGLVGPLAAALPTLVDAGVPTPFLFVYDEVWQIFASLERHIASLVGDRFLIGGDMWAWHVRPGAAGRGWAPHRDDQFAATAIGPDGTPNLVSLWVSLTEATVDNGCMYVLPSSADPNLPDRPKQGDLPRDSLADVRAQPVPAGSVLSWTADVLHWGARSTARAENPRSSVCIYAQRSDAPRFTTDMISLDSPVPLQYRLGFVARTMIRYRASRLHPDLALSPALMDFCDVHERRLQQWLAMMAGLES